MMLFLTTAQLFLAESLHRVCLLPPHSLSLPPSLSTFLLFSLPLPLSSSSQVCPEDHPAADFDFDVLIGADGRRSTIPGFDRKELRGKLALAITANFINDFTREEAGVEEISGVAFIFNQKFFKVGCGEGKRGREGVMRGRGGLMRVRGGVVREEGV